MNPNTIRFLLSSLVTFLSAFFVTIGIQLSSGIPIEWSATWLLTLLMVAGRAGLKAVFETALARKI